jgi:hypothetical protein
MFDGQMGKQLQILLPFAPDNEVLCPRQGRPRELTFSDDVFVTDAGRIPKKLGTRRQRTKPKPIINTHWKVAMARQSALITGNL